MKTKLDNLYGHASSNDAAIESLEVLVDTLETKTDTHATKITALENKANVDWVEIGRYSNTTLTGDREFQYSTTIRDQLGVKPNARIEIQYVCYSSSREKTHSVKFIIQLMNLNPSSVHIGQRIHLIDPDNYTHYADCYISIRNYQIFHIKILPVQGTTAPSLTHIWYGRPQK